jgi:hypothetical protein
MRSSSGSLRGVSLNKGTKGNHDSLEQTPPFVLYFFFQWLFQPIQCPGLLFSSVTIFFFTDGRTPWTSDQPVARPLPKHRTQTQNKRIHTPNIHVLSGIRTHDPSVQSSEESSCLRPRAYFEQLWYSTGHF